MTLHAAIENLIRQKRRPLTTREIAYELNINKWYWKKDGSKIDAYQIHGRTKRYSSIFECNGSNVSLRSDAISKVVPATKSGSLIVVKKPAVTHNKTSFRPISNSSTAVLILGTMPGERSLKLGEYYAHARNRFWKVISTITNSELPSSYHEKKTLLSKMNVGLWDVAHNASRKGSLDNAIEDVRPNDLEEFIRRHKKLKVVGFNGAKSEALHDKYFQRKASIRYLSLPSTSPANASIDFVRLCSLWQQLFEK